MSAATRPRYSIEEYVRLEEYANLKHEYLDGQIWATAGGTPSMPASRFRSAPRSSRSSAESPSRSIRRMRVYG